VLLDWEKGEQSKTSTKPKPQPKMTKKMQKMLAAFEDEFDFSAYDHKYIPWAPIAPLLPSGIVTFCDEVFMTEECFRC